MGLVLLVLKVALVGFIRCGHRRSDRPWVRRSRANRSDSRWKKTRAQRGYEASAFGAMPDTPLPEWANLDAEGEDDQDTGRLR